MVDMLNETSNVRQTLTVMPSKLFDFPIYASVPCSFALRHNVAVIGKDLQRFDSSAILYVKTRNKAEFHSRGNIYVESAKHLMGLFPGVAMNLDAY